MVFAQWGSRKPVFKNFSKTRFLALFFRGPNRPKSAKNGLFGPKFCDFRLFREILAILGEFGENRFFRFLDFWDPPDRSRQSALFEKWPVCAQKGSDLKNIFFEVSLFRLKLES